ncbi:DUF1737 domain-containing protein [Streptomyces sp. UNOC14_S4]|nr:DUF1737 domain-containing protein [Streptomyces sp. UNOC14_S4]
MIYRFLTGPDDAAFCRRVSRLERALWGARVCAGARGRL